MRNLNTLLSGNLLSNSGQNFSLTPTNPDQRLIYPAYVEQVNDGANFNRIKARIINVDGETGNFFPGRDKDKTLEQLPICIPLLPEYVHVRPKVGELVLIFLENPSDPKAYRYYIGPLVTQQTKLSNENYNSSVSIYNELSFRGNQIGTGPSTKNDNDAGELFANQEEIAFQGRNNSDIVIGNNNVKIRTGIFKDLVQFKENLEIPCQIELKIVDKPISTSGVRLADNQLNSSFEPFSQQNIKATNINLISPEGKFRKLTDARQEARYNPRIEDFGEEAKTLHPAVLGDELVDILTNIINYLFSHIHPPQSPSLPNNFAFNLERYRNKLALSAKILSNHIRLN